MKITYVKRIGLFQLSLLLLTFYLNSVPSLSIAQESLQSGINQDELIINVDNISINGELSLRGLTANFPYPILSTINIIDQQENIVIGLADTLRWLGPDDIAEIGIPVSEIWRPLLEYHQEDPSIPDDPDLYHQFPPPLVTEVRRTELLPTSTMLVMDCSSSMQEEIEDAKIAARYYIELFRPIDRGGIVQFANRVLKFQEMTNDTSLLIRTINEARLRRGTAIYKGLMAAINEIKTENGRRAIIIYTDGQDNSSAPITPEAVIDSARMHNLPIYTIVLGNDTQEDVLKRIAEQTGAMFFKTATQEEMKAIYTRLSVLMQNYYVMAHASPDPKYNNTWRIVDVTTNMQNQSGNGKGHYFVEGIPMPLMTDLSFSQIAITDTMIEWQGDTVQAVLWGGTYRYNLKIKNLGPVAATNITLWDKFPDSVTLSGFSILPSTQTANALLWEFDSLDSGDSIIIAFDALVADSLPLSPFELVNMSAVIAENDSTLDNNFVSTTVYAIKKSEPEPGMTDLSLTFASRTDTFVVVNLDTINAVLPGDSFNYDIRIENLGPYSTDSVTLVHRLPDSVRYIDATMPPQLVAENSVAWEINDFQAGSEFNVSVTVQLVKEIPQELIELISEAEIQATNDTTITNNFAVDTVHVLFPELPIQHYDLSLSQVAMTDTMIIWEGDTVQAVLWGGTYRYNLKIKNLGPVAATNFTLWDAFPDSVTLSGFTMLPSTQTADTLFWVFDSLDSGDSIIIAFDALVADSLPLSPFPLVNMNAVIAENDSTLDNNFVSTTVYAIKKSEPEPGMTDLALTFTSLTDTFVVVNLDTMNAVLPGDSFNYDIRIKNLGPYSTDSVTLVHRLPDSVRYIDATIPPQLVAENSLAWEINDFQAGSEFNVSVTVQLVKEIPQELIELVSEAEILATNDTTITNNFAVDTVRVLLSELPIQHYNLAMKQKVSTDTTIVIAGDSFQAVIQGDTYRYRLIIKNYGPGTAHDFTCRDAIPDSIITSKFNISPTKQTVDTLFWDFTSLANGDSIIISFDATVAESLLFTPFPLVNTCEVVAEHDTLTDDNLVISQVYAIARPHKPQPQTADIAAYQTTLTDSFTVVGDDTLWFVHEAETYSNFIRVTNESSVAAYDVSVTNIYPDSVDPGDFQPSPQMITADSVVWNLGILLPQTSSKLYFQATVPAKMPIGKNLLINKAIATADNEDPNLLNNNISIDTVFNLVKFSEDWQPVIEATPPIVEIGNTVSIRVQVPAPIESWDLWIYFANDEIDSLYANEFIASTTLEPNVWYEVEPKFSNTRLVTQQKREQIIFELRTIDVFGDFRNAQASVMVQSNDDFTVDRNVFIPDQENEIAIRFKLSSNREACLDVYDITGTQITKLTEAQYQAGWNTFYWDGLTEKGQKIGSGFYIITLRSGGYRAWKKLMIVR